MTAPADIEVVRDELGERVREAFETFLTTYESQDEELRSRAPNPEELKEYIVQIDNMIRNERTTLYVDFTHLLGAQVGGGGGLAEDLTLGELIELEYYRFLPHLQRGVQSVVQQRDESYATTAEKGDKEFFLSFYKVPSLEKLRDLRTDRIGKLLCISGTVTRTSEVRPELLYGAFSCLECGTLNADVPQQFRYTEPTKCRNGNCNNRSRWTLDVDLSKFVDYQRVRIQENPSEIPSGAMPRSMDIVLRHEAVEMAKAGDKCIFTGTLIVVPDVGATSKPGQKVKASRNGQGSRGSELAQGVTGLKALGVRDMSYKLAFLGCSVQPEEARTGATNIRGEMDANESIIDQFTDEEREEIFRMKSQTNLYDRMASSIAPAVFGHKEIKRGVLLMLFGGVNKSTAKDKIKLRGDINVCVVGDPSTAKSQFLKYVVDFLPRAVYASGKASTAAGLTASVAKDPETGEFCIEAGALMLADNGICCIDEFDKMDVKDQVAIHEAMEQQTISIAKAGIQATLNARTSILAAANPINGRYDMSRSLKYNVNMTPAIMSRFDLFFIVVDQCSDSLDYQIARHIVSLHRHRAASLDPDYSREQLQRYIKFARSINPRIVSEETKALFVEHYRKLRQSDVTGGRSYRITVRQLESMIRLAEALARLHLDQEVRPEYVNEAARLLRKSIIHVEADDISLDVGDIDYAMQGGASDPAPGASDPPAQPAAPAAPEAPTSLPFEEYQRIVHLMVLHLRSPGVVPEDAPGTSVPQLRQWYLEEIEDQITSTAQLGAVTNLVNLVIHRLVHIDQILLVVGRVDDDADHDALDNQYVIVHPNYTI